MASYKDYAEAQCLRYPSLTALCHFLSDPASDRYPCRIAALRFFDGIRVPSTSDIKPSDLRSELAPQTPQREIRSSKDRDKEKWHNLLGEILIVEDLTRNVVETLGAMLDIDPMFFAKHLADSRFTFFDPSTPQSRSWLKSYINVFYHRVISFEEQVTPVASPLNVSRTSNVPRKVVVFPAMGSTKIGLIQHCCSMLMISRSQQPWLGVVLCDPRLEGSYACDGHDKALGALRPSLFLGGFEDFMERTSFQDTTKWPRSPGRQGLKEDLQYYWECEAPECFDEASLSLWALSDYPLKIIVQEWSKYVTVLYRCVKHFEYSNNEASDFLNGLQRLDSHLRLLQSWRRRIMSSQQKIDVVTRFIRAQKDQQLQSRDIEEMLEDYIDVKEAMNTYGQRLENMLPVVTSLVQLVDSRRSFTETANISRLTILALVFIPLTFVSGLLSMDGEYAPGGRHFWVYIVVATPLTLTVFLIARLVVDGDGMTSLLVLLWKNLLSHVLEPRICHTRQEARPEALDA